MDTPQYDFFAQYERAWDARSSTSTSLDDIPPTILPVTAQDYSTFASSTANDVYEVPSPVLRSIWVLQYLPIDNAIEIMSTQAVRSRFVENFAAPPMSEATYQVYTATRSTATGWASSTSTLVNCPASSSSSSPSSIYGDDGEEVPETDNRYLGNLGLRAVDSREVLQMQRQLVCGERKGGKVKRVKKALTGAVKRVLKALAAKRSVDGVMWG